MCFQNTEHAEEIYLSFLTSLLSQQQLAMQMEMSLLLYALLLKWLTTEKKKLDLSNVQVTATPAVMYGEWCVTFVNVTGL